MNSQALKFVVAVIMLIIACQINQAEASFHRLSHFNPTYWGRVACKIIFSEEPIRDQKIEKAKEELASVVSEYQKYYDDKFLERTDIVFAQFHFGRYQQKIMDKHKNILETIMSLKSSLNLYGDFWFNKDTGITALIDRLSRGRRDEWKSNSMILQQLKPEVSLNEEKPMLVKDLAGEPILQIFFNIDSYSTSDIKREGVDEEEQSDHCVEVENEDQADIAVSRDAFVHNMSLSVADARRPSIRQIVHKQFRSENTENFRNIRGDIGEFPASQIRLYESTDFEQAPATQYAYPVCTYIPAKNERGRLPDYDLQNWRVPLCLLKSQ